AACELRHLRPAQLSLGSALCLPGPIPPSAPVRPYLARHCRRRPAQLRCDLTQRRFGLQAARDLLALAMRKPQLRTRTGPRTYTSMAPDDLLDRPRTVPHCCGDGSVLLAIMYSSSNLLLLALRQSSSRPRSPLHRILLVAIRTFLQ